MTSPQENHWWLSVQYSSADPMRVERFETQEQAELHSAMTGGHVLAPHTTNNTIYHNILYDYCMAFSERAE